MWGKTRENYQQTFCTKNNFGNIFNTANRHIYTNWVPLTERRAYRDDVNPYLTPEGTNVRYDENTAPRTLDILQRSVILSAGWQDDFADLEKQMKAL